MSVKCIGRFVTCCFGIGQLMLAGSCIGQTTIQATGLWNVSVQIPACSYTQTGTFQVNYSNGALSSFYSASTGLNLDCSVAPAWTCSGSNYPAATSSLAAPDVRSALNQLLAGCYISSSIQSVTLTPPDTVTGTGTTYGNAFTFQLHRALPTAVGTNGACGSASGTSMTTTPTGNLCATGTASAVAGAGPWVWTCSGSNGGTTASCAANTTAAIPGASGASLSQFASRATLTPTQAAYGAFALVAPSHLYLAVRGPSLGTLGVTATPLARPQVNLYTASGTLLASSNQCAGATHDNAMVVVYYQQARQAPLDVNDACIGYVSTTLPAGVYTFQIIPDGSAPNASGEVLFEVSPID